MTLNQIWLANQRIGDKAELAFTEGMDDVEDAIFELLRAMLKQFDSEGGKFTNNESAIQIINRVRKGLQRVIEDSGLDRNIDKLLFNFDAIAANIQAAQLDLNGIRVPQTLITKQQALFVDQVVFNLRDANVATYFTEPVKKLLYSRVTQGASLLQTERALRQIIKGSDGELGTLSRWAGQVSRDAINQYGGALNQEIKTTYGLTKTAYLGSLVEDSRAQCRKWVAMGAIPDSQLASEIRWALNGGQYEDERAKGMIKGTDTTNFCQNRGGYNCRHEAIPIR